MYIIAMLLGIVLLMALPDFLFASVARREEAHLKKFKNDKGKEDNEHAEQQKHRGTEKQWEERPGD